MIVYAAAVTMALVFVIAAVVVGREARRLDAVPPTPVFDLDEATAWIAEHLPASATAVLSYTEVRRIIELSLEFLRTQTPRRNGSTPAKDTNIVVGSSETVAFVLSRARDEGLEDLRAADVHFVVEAQLAYLEAIGAVGPEAAEEPPD